MPATAQPARVRPLNGLLIGTVADGEFTSVRAWLGERVQDGDLSLRELARHHWPGDDHHLAPDLVVILQSWSDEWTSTQVEQLIGRWPLARIICCHGAWCVSDGRTRGVWPWAFRVPIDRAIGRLEQELEMLSDRHPPLPFTASREEAFVTEYLSGQPTTGDEMPHLYVTVLTLDRDYGETLVEVLTSWGLDCVHLQSPDAFSRSAGPDRPAAQGEVLLLDVDGWRTNTDDRSDDGVFDWIQAVRKTCPQITILAVSTDCSPPRRVTLRSLGVPTMLSRLAPVALLRSAIVEMFSDILPGLAEL